MFNKIVTLKALETNDNISAKFKNLSMLSELGLNVPEVVAVTNPDLKDQFRAKIFDAVKTLERLTSCTLEQQYDPLLLSVRSGASISMPGILTTIINVGITIEKYKYLCENYNESFAFDMFMNYIRCLGVSSGIDPFEIEFFKMSLKQNDFESILKMIDFFQQKTKTEFIWDSWLQVLNSAKLVYDSAFSKNAMEYKRIKGLNCNLKSDIIFQRMVFGNLNEKSLSGVASMADGKLSGEYKMRSQGDCIMSGSSYTKKIHDLSFEFPKVYSELRDSLELISKANDANFEVEFTVCDSKLYFLQARKVSERRIKHERQLGGSLVKITNGIACGSGKLVSGKIFFNIENISRAIENGDDVIFLKRNNDTLEIEIILKSNAVLTLKGGYHCHGAVIARQNDLPCVSSLKNVRLAEDSIILNDAFTLPEGSEIIVDGEFGNIYKK